jgi:hypothetical protein
LREEIRAYQNAVSAVVARYDDIHRVTGASRVKFLARASGVSIATATPAPEAAPSVATGDIGAANDEQLT